MVLARSARTPMYLEPDVVHSVQKLIGLYGTHDLQHGLRAPRPQLNWACILKAGTFSKKKKMAAWV